MPLSKVHVECGHLIPAGRNADLFEAIWSETIDPGQMTQRTATLNGKSTQTGLLVFRVRAPTAAEIFVAEGSAPDATQAVSTSDDNTRAHLAEGEIRDIPTKVGAKLATAPVA